MCIRDRLESLRDPVAPSATEFKPSKDFAWQAAKGNAGPMASALQRAAEAAGKTVEPAPAKPHLVVEAQKSASSSRGSAAAAPAMAREFSESSVETAATEHVSATPAHAEAHSYSCLLYTSDAADERSSVDLGGRRIIKKKR